MTFIKETYPIEYTCALRLANCYVALYVKEDKKICISKRLENDQKIALILAKCFANANNIYFVNEAYDLPQEIITVVKQQKKWFPAVVYPNKFTLFETFRHIYLGDTKKEAIKTAKKIASMKQRNFIPSIGIPLSN